MTGPIEVGAFAPEFALRDQNNQMVSLSGLLADRDVLLVFFPLAFTGTCEGELGFLRDNEPRFNNAELATVAISVGPPPTHKVWSSAQGFLFPILSDFWPHGQVAKQYGVFDDDHGFPNRGTVLIGRDGIVKFSAMVGPGEKRENDTWDAALGVLN